MLKVAPSPWIGQLYTMQPRRPVSWLLGAMLVLAAPAQGAISLVTPFQGNASENFDNLGITGAQQLISIFGGTATVSNLTSGGALKIEYSSSLNGVLVVPRSPPLMLGQIGISEWVF